MGRKPLKPAIVSKRKSIIAECKELNYSYARIALECGLETTVGLRRFCETYGIDLPKRKGKQGLGVKSYEPLYYIRVQKETGDAFSAAASVRSVSVRKLVAELLEIIIEENMLDNILDDGA